MIRLSSELRDVAAFAAGAITKASPDVETRKLLLAEVRKLCSDMVDTRNTLWRCRFLIYDNLHDEEPLADSDDGLDLGQPGSMVLAGLPAVATEAAVLASVWHESSKLLGLGQPDLDRVVRGIRSTLSRNGGKATMRINYDTQDSWSDTPDHKPRFKLRVEIVREGKQ